jgi:hypothetical protein
MQGGENIQNQERWSERRKEAVETAEEGRRNSGTPV